MRVFSTLEYFLLLRSILRTVPAADVFFVFLAIVLSSEVILSDGEDFSYF
jgi:hypothetical protein